MGKPFLYKFPLGLVIIGSLVILGGLGALFGKASPVPTSPAQVQQLLEDPRYPKALEIMAECGRQLEAAGPGPDGQTSSNPFEAAVEYLVREGVPAAEAEANLNLILNSP